MSLEEILSHRYQFEEIVGDKRRKYNLPAYDGRVECLKYFVKKGFYRNRFRNKSQQAYEAAKLILEHC